MSQRVLFLSPAMENVFRFEKVCEAFQLQICLLVSGAPHLLLEVVLPVIFLRRVHPDPPRSHGGVQLQEDAKSTAWAVGVATARRA